MIEEISTMDIRKHLGRILDRVDLKHDQFIIERKGRPMAVIIPYSVFNVKQFEEDQQLTKAARLLEENEKFNEEMGEWDVLSSDGLEDEEWS